MAAVLLAAAPCALFAATTGDWPTYGHDKGGQRFSPLDQITPANVGSLAVAWTYHMKTGGEGTRFRGSQATPIVVDGRMFVSTPYGRVVALDPASGRELWVAEIAGAPPSLRGVEYWAGDAATAPRLFFGTRDGRLLALDAATGKPAAGFGAGGAIDLKTPEILGHESLEALSGKAAGPAGVYGMTSPPIVWGDLVITGGATQEVPVHGASGDVRAWDARTGKLRWTFHAIPKPGEPGHDSWAPGSAEGRSGVNVWGFMTVDAERGIVYMPFGAPAWDRYGGDRPGDNLYGSSLVAADVRTGRYLWHFQAVHHDIWDVDLQAPPLLFDARVGGRTIPAVAITTKSGLLFMLDRTTGKPVHPIEERPVPASTVPGEKAAPTQPFPVNTPPLARNSFALDDIADLTPEHRAFCTDLVVGKGAVFGGPYLPLALDRPTISFPGLQGGSNWGGAAFDPTSGLLFLNTSDLGQVSSLVAAEPGSPLPYKLGPLNSRFQQGETRLMCQKPPWGRLSAVDTATGKIAWQVSLGVSDTLPEGLRDTGRPSAGGAIATAGGLVFIGATDDSRFRAFSSRTGEALWTWRLPASAHATPVSYRGADGRQYVAVVATGGSLLFSAIDSDAIVAFALPADKQ